MGHPAEPSYEGLVISQQERELPGHGIRGLTITPGAGLALMSIPFFAVAVLAGLFVTGAIGNFERTDMPWSVPVVFGGMFALAGGWFVVTGVRGALRAAGIAKLQRANPHEPWRWDHPWSLRMTDGARRRVVGAFAFPALWYAFLVPFHVIFGFETMWIMDAVGLIVVGQAVYLALRYRRYGQSTLELAKVPFRAGEPFVAALLPTRANAVLTTVTATLRYVEERTVTRGTGKKRRAEVVAFERCAITRTLDASALAWHKPLQFSMPIPKGARHHRTELRSNPPRYWEVELSSEVAGIDFSAIFLVPIY